MLSEQKKSHFTVQSPRITVFAIKHQMLLLSEQRWDSIGVEVCVLIKLLTTIIINFEVPCAASAVVGKKKDNK